MTPAYTWGLLVQMPPALPAQKRNPDAVRRDYIHQVIDACGGNISRAARELGMHRRTLQRVLQKRHPEYRILEAA